MSFTVKNALGKVVDLLYPRRCAICDEVLPSGRKYICRECVKKPVYIREPYCSKCGRQLPESAEYCRDCEKTSHEFAQGRAVFDYGSIAKSLYRFKYSGRAEYARFYAKAIYERNRDYLRVMAPDALVPVPLHEKRMRKRGYNQAEEITKELSKLTGIPVRAGLVQRTSDTQALKSLGRNERRKILKNAFKIQENDVKLEKVCVIDDIYTTGSTIDEIARVLKEAFGCKVYFLAVTIGRGL